MAALGFGACDGLVEDGDVAFGREMNDVLAVGAGF